MVRPVCSYPILPTHRTCFCAAFSRKYNVKNPPQAAIPQQKKSATHVPKPGPHPIIAAATWEACVSPKSRASPTPPIYSLTTAIPRKPFLFHLAMESFYGILIISDLS